MRRWLGSAWRWQQFPQVDRWRFSGWPGPGGTWTSIPRPRVWQWRFWCWRWCSRNGRSIQRFYNECCKLRFFTYFLNLLLVWIYNVFLDLRHLFVLSITGKGLILFVILSGPITVLLWEARSQESSWQRWSAKKKKGSKKRQRSEFYFIGYIFIIRLLYFRYTYLFLFFQHKHQDRSLFLLFARYDIDNKNNVSLWMHESCTN